MTECFKYNDEKLAEFCEIHHKAIRCILNDTGLYLYPSYYNEDEQKQNYIIIRNKILYDRNQIGEIVRHVSKTRPVYYSSAPLLTRFTLYSKKLDFTIEEHSMSTPNIIEFSIDTDNLSSEETLVKLAKLKECAMQVRQLHIIDLL